MEKLIILDYTDSTVHIYDLASDHLDIDEEYIENLGHSCYNCGWMCGEMEITFHKETLE